LSVAEPSAFVVTRRLDARRPIDLGVEAFISAIAAGIPTRYTGRCTAVDASPVYLMHSFPTL
jgi:hypothetical protein